MLLPALGHQLVGKDLVFVVVEDDVLARQEAVPGARVSETVGKYNCAAVARAPNSVVALLGILLDGAPSAGKDVHERFVHELDANDVRCVTVTLSDLRDNASGE
jgi:hypothetical protein